MSGVLLNNPGVMEALTYPNKLSFDSKECGITEILRMIYIDILSKISVHRKDVVINSLKRTSAITIASSVADGPYFDEMLHLSEDGVTISDVIEWLELASGYVIAGICNMSDQCILKLDLLNQTGMEFGFDLVGSNTLILRFSKTLKVAEVPYVCKQEMSGESSAFFI